MAEWLKWDPEGGLGNQNRNEMERVWWDPDGEGANELKGGSLKIFFLIIAIDAIHNPLLKSINKNFKRPVMSKT